MTTYPQYPYYRLESLRSCQLACTVRLFAKVMKERDIKEANTLTLYPYLYPIPYALSLYPYCAGEGGVTCYPTPQGVLYKKYILKKTGHGLFMP